MKMQRGGGRAVNELIYGEFEQMRRIVVLLAEDEELLRMVSAEALRDEGFEVMEAEHAEAALKSLHAKASDIHVLFTDIQMPGTMDGP
jgi:CheY-like chemotaxis protein